MICKQSYVKTHTLTSNCKCENCCKFYSELHMVLPLAALISNFSSTHTMYTRTAHIRSIASKLKENKMKTAVLALCLSCWNTPWGASNKGPRHIPWPNPNNVIDSSKSELRGLRSGNFKMGSSTYYKVCMWVLIWFVFHVLHLQAVRDTQRKSFGALTSTMKHQQKSE